MFRITAIETPGLGDRSYLADDEDLAVVIDPQRDIDRVLALLDQHRLRLQYVLETHIHNDYVTGGYELAQRTGAEYVIAADDEVSYARMPIHDGDVLAVGRMRIRALATPGHTYHHMSYVLSDASGIPEAVFTGGSLLYGTTGRTDLLGTEHTVSLSHLQYASVRRLVTELPPETRIFPTHGFGSFCSATPASDLQTTLGQETRINPALTLDEQRYVDTLVAGLDVYPAYYTRIAPINRKGPEPVDLSLPEPVDPAELRRRIAAGEWVVDLRDRVAFAAGHLPGSLAFELSRNFVTYLGWLYRWDVPLTLIGPSRQLIADARRELVRIGLDSLTGMAVGDIATLADGDSLRSYRVSDFHGLAAAMEERPISIVDARRPAERRQGGVRGSLHIPVHELNERIDEVPSGEVWVYCGSGYRASIAASMLDRPGRNVVLVDDDYDTARLLGLEG